MKYYLISIVGNEHKVIGTATNIKYARKISKEEIDYNREIWGYAEGITICTDNVIKSYICEDKREMRYESGAKLRNELKGAIEKYKERGCRLV